MRAATERGFGTAVLGNPAPRGRIEELLKIQRPNFFQVSLEGLPDHNDAIRGPGHFERVMEFLGVLRELRIYSMVMLTLTRDNLDQVLPWPSFFGDGRIPLHSTASLRSRRWSMAMALTFLKTEILIAL